MAKGNPLGSRKNSKQVKRNDLPSSGIYQLVGGQCDSHTSKSGENSQLPRNLERPAKFDKSYFHTPEHFWGFQYLPGNNPLSIVFAGNAPPLIIKGWISAWNNFRKLPTKNKYKFKGFAGMGLASGSGLARILVWHLRFYWSPGRIRMGMWGNSVPKDKKIVKNEKKRNSESWALKRHAICGNHWLTNRIQDKIPLLAKFVISHRILN